MIADYFGVKKNEETIITGAFGAAVKTVRNRCGISQEALADRCALDRTYISGIERGVRNPTVRSIWRISNALQVLPSDLFREAELFLTRED